LANGEEDPWPTLGVGGGKHLCNKKKLGKRIAREGLYIFNEKGTGEKEGGWLISPTVVAGARVWLFTRFLRAKRGGIRLNLKPRGEVGGRGRGKCRPWGGEGEKKAVCGSSKQTQKKKKKNPGEQVANHTRGPT